MAGSAMGMMGQEALNNGKTPGATKNVIMYITAVAAAVAGITKDPQLSAIAAGLGSHLPIEAPQGDPLAVPAKDPGAPPEEPVTAV